MNRFAPPKADTSRPAVAPSAVDVQALTRANKSLKHARLAFVLFFVSYFLVGYAADRQSSWLPVSQMALAATFIAAHGLLGLSAKRAGRSALLFGVLPLLVPVLGGLIAFAVLWHKIDGPDQDRAGADAPSGQEDSGTIRP